MLRSLLALSTFAAVAAAAGPSLIVRTTSGLVQGHVDNTNSTTVPLLKWFGIPFAADTSGKNRFRPPQPVVPAPGVFNATHFGPACLQGQVNGGNGTASQSEDCLRVNIIAPPNAEGLPVYVYSYGGGFTSGASSDPKIDGSYLAQKDIVFVSYNYRLSMFGYPHSAEIAATGQTQNIGLLDTRAAVEWVVANIHLFGGDPTKIVFGGESVGAEMTNQYLSAFPHDPLIRGAVMQSSDTSQPMWPINQQLEIIARNVSCPTGPGLLDCLRTKDGVALQHVLWATGAQFQPVIDNVTIFQDYVKQTREGRTAKVPLLIGTNKDEGSVIVNGDPTAFEANMTAYAKSNTLNFPHDSVAVLEKLYPVPSVAYPTPFNASAGIWRDAHMLCLAHNLATQRTEALGLPVWRYRFDLVESNLNALGSSVGAFHGVDIRFVMGTWRTIVYSQPFVAATPHEIAISALMVEAWTNFIKNPEKGPQIPGWKQYDPRDPTSLAILGLSEVEAQPGNHTATDAVCDYWNTLLPNFPQTFPACGSWTC